VEVQGQPELADRLVRGDEERLYQRDQGDVKIPRISLDRTQNPYTRRFPSHQEPEKAWSCKLGKRKYRSCQGKKTTYLIYIKVIRLFETVAK